jgi:hypothetical protein
VQAGGMLHSVLIYQHTKLIEMTDSQSFGQSVALEMDDLKQQYHCVGIIAFHDTMWD